LQRIAVGDWERSGSGERGVKECEGAARKERAKREMREMAVATAMSLFISMFKKNEDRGGSLATDSPKARTKPIGTEVRVGNRFFSPWPSAPQPLVCWATHVS